MFRHRYRPRFPAPETGSRADWGLPSRDLKNDPGMTHLAHTYWARTPAQPAGTDGTSVLLPAERAALLRPLFGPDVAVGGISAAQLWGIPVMTGMNWAQEVLGERAGPAFIDPRPHLSFCGRRRHQGRLDLVLRQGLGLPVENGLWGCRVTGAIETLLAIQPVLPGWRSVVAADYVLATGLGYHDPRWPLAPEDLLALLDRLPPRTRGRAALRLALHRCAPNVWSPMETLLRLILVHAGLPTPTPNAPVLLPNGSRAYLDLAWEEEKVAVEYNGEVHYRDRKAYGDEMHRLAQLRRLGWAVHIAVLEDLRERRRREAMLREIRGSLARRARPH